MYYHTYGEEQRILAIDLLLACKMLDEQEVILAGHIHVDLVGQSKANMHPIQHCYLLSQTGWCSLLFFGTEFLQPLLHQHEGLIS